MSLWKACTLLLLSTPLVCAQSTNTGNLSSGAMLGIAFGIIGVRSLPSPLLPLLTVCFPGRFCSSRLVASLQATALAFVGIALVLHYRNTHGYRESNQHRSWPVRFLIFFINYVLFELATVPFTIASIIQMYQSGTFVVGQPPPLTQSSLDSIRIAYIVFVVLKYAVCIFVGFMENWGPAVCVVLGEGSRLFGCI